MNRSMYKFALAGYILTFFGTIGFFFSSFHKFSQVNYVFLVPLFIGIFLSIYKSNNLYDRPKRLIITLDFVYVMALISVLAVPSSHLFSTILAIIIGVLVPFFILKVTFGAARSRTN